MNRARVVFVLSMLAVSGGTGCDRVGQSLVGHDDPPEKAGELHVKCTIPPPCDDAFVPMVAEMLLPRVVAPACEVISPACAVLTSPGEDAGAVIADAPGCSVVDDMSELVDRAASVINCAQLKIENRTRALDASTKLEGVSWSNSSISITSSTPWLLELEGASLREAFIQLSGPVTLRIARPTEFRDVRVVSVVSGAGEPTLELLEVRKGTLAAGDASEQFDGTLRLTRTLLSGPQLMADRVVLESVTFKDAIVEANDLSAADADIDTATLAFETAVISASTLHNVQVMDCGQLTLLAGRAQNLRVPTCRTPPLRVYGTIVVRGIVDGEIESDMATWERVIFGLHEPTNLVAWSGKVSSSDFCSQSETVKIGGSGSVACSSCEGRPTPSACAIPPSNPGRPTNVCPVLLSPPPCSEPLPVRMHPTPNAHFF